ncbi:site-specific DNA-methyltransferase, partial [Xanthomonas hortorum pv. vitians]
MPLLSWFNRDADLTRAALFPYRLLEPVAKLSVGDPDAPNMLIKGDNIEALKALLPYYSGQVKCVYADPPFNTGQAFDDYDDNLEHSIWLSMMYPSIELTRELLSEDGTLFVHIDDNELAYLTVILDEVMVSASRKIDPAITRGLRHTSHQGDHHAQEQVHREPDRRHAEAG